VDNLNPEESKNNAANAAERVAKSSFTSDKPS